MEAKKLLRIGWQQAIKEWVAKTTPALADDFVQFFSRAFNTINYPDQTYFGVHSTCISLCIGNIWLAAFNSGIWLLVDESFQDSRFDFKPAKSTERYIPLYWLIAPAEKVKEILSFQEIWDSYANACLKVLKSPISRINIRKNQVNKVRLSDLVAGATKQLPADGDLQEFAEGGIQEVTLELRRRNPLLRNQAIAKYGYRCQICGFSFEELYGDLGKGYIEVHHLTPLSDCESETPTGLEEVTVVCANCHRVLHRHGKKPIPIERLREIVQSKK